MNVFLVLSTFGTTASALAKVGRASSVLWRRRVKALEFFWGQQQPEGREELRGAGSARLCVAPAPPAGAPLKLEALAASSKQRRGAAPALQPLDSAEACGSRFPKVVAVGEPPAALQLKLQPGRPAAHL